MVKHCARRHRDAMSAAAILLAGMTLASCASQPATRPQAAAPETVAAAPNYATPDAAIRAVLAEPGALSLASPTTRDALLAHYARTGYAPLWLTSDGLSSQGAQLFRALDKAAAAGSPELQPFMARINERRASPGAKALAELDVLLSAALLDTAVNPTDPMQPAQMDRLLTAAADAPVGARFLAEWLPPDPAFWNLRSAVDSYQAIVATGGWPAVSKGDKIEPGSHGPRVAALRARLEASGDAAGATGDPEFYDDQLRLAVEKFQRRHGLTVDGVVGPGTLDALNVSAEARLTTLTANLRRLQRQARDWGDTYIAVNTAAARYRLVDGGRTVFDEVTIVGQPDWKTPEIHSEIERLELNPYWTVPPRIARLELAEEIAKDPEYLQKHNMRQINGMYRQEPGPGNALGKAKFLFPNPHDVYLHDTNSHRLFKRDRRHLSHGCVRIPNAVALAEYLLKDDPDWSPDQIDSVLKRGKNRGVTLARPMPVHIVYDTAWVDDGGAVQFRQDIYGRDSTTLAEAN